MSTTRTIAVVGAGIMGRGIALVSAQSGFATRVIEPSAEAIESAKAEVGRILARAVEKAVHVPSEKGTHAAAEADATRGRLSWSSGLDAARGCDLVIEAVPESLAIKSGVYRGLAPHLGTGTVIATNTSSMSITELAATSDRPARFVGMHFFNPVHRMRLVELVRGLETGDEALALAQEVSHAMHKETVVVRESPGFVTTRINALIGNEAFAMLEAGVASARDIDKAIRLGLNHPMGPFEMIDLVGLDTRLSILEYLHRTLGEKFRPNPLHVRYVQEGRLGRKSGRGVHEYPNPEKTS